jgi:hypothetical protein
MTRSIVPLANIDRRMPEAGRIRLGVKQGNRPTSIDTFRFTSPYEDVIEGLAAIYGGVAKPWKDPKANPPDQFEVITRAKQIDVYIVRDGLSSWYEEWAGGGCLRRCDGEMCQIPQTTGPDQVEMVEVPCLCIAAGERRCDPHTRLNVILPDIPFRGVWRLQTKGWNAAHELPGMVDMIDHLSVNGHVVQAVLGIEARTQSTPGRRKRNFVVPKLSILNTPKEIQQGLAAAGATPAIGPSTVTQVALPVATMTPPDDEVIDAEVVDDELFAAEEAMRADAINFGLDPNRYLAAGREQILNSPHTPGTMAERLAKCSAVVRSGRMEPIGFNPDGSIQWSKPR